MSRPSKLERETIIIFNEEESFARVFTYSKRWQTVLSTRCKGKLLYDNGYGGQEIEIDKSCIRIPLPSRKAAA